MREVGSYLGARLLADGVALARYADAAQPSRRPEKRSVADNVFDRFPATDEHRAVDLLVQPASISPWCTTGSRSYATCRSPTSRSPSWCAPPPMTVARQRIWGQG